MKNNIEETHTIYQDAHLLRAQLRTLPINNLLDEELANLTTEIEVTLKTCITTKGMFEHGAKMLNQNLQGGQLQDSREVTASVPCMGNLM